VNCPVSQQCNTATQVRNQLYIRKTKITVQSSLKLEGYNKLWYAYRTLLRQNRHTFIQQRLWTTTLSQSTTHSPQREAQFPKTNVFRNKKTLNSFCIFSHVNVLFQRRYLYETLVSPSRVRAFWGVWLSASKQLPIFRRNLLHSSSRPIVLITP
jgi:adenine-specific DNA glycosylase